MSDRFAVRLEHAPRSARDRALPLVYWTERQAGPRPLTVHVVRVDLRHPELDIVAMIADDPDGDGPAEAVLTDPLELADRYQALAAVNANAFGALPSENGTESGSWRSGLPVTIAGLAVHDGRWRSGAYHHSGNHMGFWIDHAGQAHIGPIPEPGADVREGINAWWHHVVDDGRILPRPNDDRHPRTAVGLDATGRWLWLVVADGRRPLRSVGMTPYELGALMVRLGADRAINLDGGGSSIMLVARPDGLLDIVNRPSGGQPRPVPVMLGIRRRLN